MPSPDRLMMCYLGNDGEELMLLSHLRAQWATLRTRVQNFGLEVMAPSSVGYRQAVQELSDTDDVCTVLIRSEDMMRVCIAPSVTDVEEHSRHLSEALPAELVARTIGEFYTASCLNKRWALSETDWLHFGLLEQQAPSLYDLEKITSKLKEWVRVESTAQDTLLHTFLRCCEGFPEPRLRIQQANKILNQWIENGTFDTFEEGTFDSVLEIEGCHVVVPIQRLQKLVKSVEFQSHEEFTYYEFLLHVLGCPKTKVQIYMFDMSKGHAKWISPALVGEEVSGIWHTSVVAFDHEYWFGGSVFMSEAGKSAWGKPTRIYDMPGWTLRSREELMKHIQSDTSWRFTSERYDILTNNCNHFSDALSMFLLNSHLPDNILHQPNLIMGSNGTPLQVIRPVLNKLLGGFDAKDDKELPIDPLFAEYTEKKRALLTPFSYVFWEYREGWTRTAFLLSISDSDEICEVQWLDARTGIARRENAVPLRSLTAARPLTANQSALLRLGLRLAANQESSSSKAGESESLPCLTQRIPRPKRKLPERRLFTLTPSAPNMECI